MVKAPAVLCKPRRDRYYVNRDLARFGERGIHTSVAGSWASAARLRWAVGLGYEMDSRHFGRAAGMGRLGKPAAGLGDMSSRRYNISEIYHLGATFPEGKPAAGLGEHEDARGTRPLQVRHLHPGRVAADRRQPRHHKEQLHRDEVEAAESCVGRAGEEQLRRPVRQVPAVVSQPRRDHKGIAISTCSRRRR